MSTLSPDQPPDGWGAIAADYEMAFEGLTTQLAADVLGLLGLQPGERVIDVAAGTGAFSLRRVVRRECRDAWKSCATNAERHG
jgi:hypothetical protein